VCIDALVTSWNGVLGNGEALGLAVKCIVRDTVTGQRKSCEMVGLPSLSKAHETTDFHLSKTLRRGCLPPFSP